MGCTRARWKRRAIRCTTRGRMRSRTCTCRRRARRGEELLNQIAADERSSAVLRRANYKIPILIHQALSLEAHLSTQRPRGTAGPYTRSRAGRRPRQARLRRARRLLPLRCELRMAMRRARSTRSRVADLHPREQLDEFPEDLKILALLSPVFSCVRSTPNSREARRRRRKAGTAEFPERGGFSTC